MLSSLTDFNDNDTLMCELSSILTQFYFIPFISCSRTAHSSCNMEAGREAKFRTKQTVGEVSLEPDITRSLRRRRRHQKEDAFTNQPNSISTSLINTGVVQPQAQSFQSSYTFSAELKPVQHHLTSSSEQDPVFHNGLDKSHTFVRNSSLRRNRRSRKSTAGSSRSSENESDICKNSLSDGSVRLARAHIERLREEVVYIPEETLHSGSAEDRPVRGVIVRDTGHRVSSKFDSSPDASSPGVSPYRSPSAYPDQGNTAASKRTAVSYVQGATCQYKTISTPFRGPLWDPVPSVSDTPPARLRQRCNANNSNNIEKDYSQSEWPRSVQHTSRTATANHRCSVETACANGVSQNHQQKNSARVVFKAIGKKLFSAKGKTTTASGQHTPVTERNPNSYKNSNFSRDETPKSRRTLQPSPFQQRSDVFGRGVKTSSKVAYSWERPTKQTAAMAGVASLPHAVAGEPGKFAKSGKAAFKPEARGSEEDEDTGESSVAELEGLLKQYTDRDKRVKIRETIRLLKQDLQQEDTLSAESHQSYRSIEDSPPPGEFSGSSQQQTPQSSLSRFAGRSTSLRNPRPSYQPPAQAVHRANSFKLSRPKDFILQKVGSSPLLTKVPEAAPSEDFKKLTDSLNNNIPNYTAKAADHTAATHNKTASPFSASSPAAYRTQVWSPPASSYSSKQQKTPVRLSVTVTAHSAPASTLRRSESTKENRCSDSPTVSVVHGNIRRSKSILGRILGQKIDTEKTPFTPPSFIAPTPERQKPPVLSVPKGESPKPAPRKRQPAKADAHFSPNTADSTPAKAPSPHRRTISSAPSDLGKAADESSKSPSEPEERRIESGLDETVGRNSSSTSSEDERFCEPSDTHSQTLSEIIQATRDQRDSETLSVPLTAEDDQSSSVQRSTGRDQSAELESEKLPSGDEKEELLQQDSVQVEHSFCEQPKEIFSSLEEKSQDTTAKARVIRQSLKSHTVLETERVQLFHVHIVRPIGPRPRQPPPHVTKKSEKKETRSLSPSSLSSLTSESDNSDDGLSSDDEASESEDCSMDRYSSRALQNRSSVKSQVLAKENDVSANPSTKTPAHRRDRHNKPLNTGVDLKSRMQKFKGLNGETETEKTPPVKRNGSARVPVASGRKLDTSRFDKSGDENEKHASAGKSSITRGTADSQSTSIEEKSRREKEKVSGSENLPRRENTAALSGDKAGSSGSGSATDDSSRARRKARSKLGAETESGAGRLERASEDVTPEPTSERSGSETVISTRKSRNRTRNEDANNNKPEDAAPSSDNVEKSVEESLSGWSARRRKKRQQFSTESPVVTSGTENEKSAEESQKAVYDEEAKEAKATLKHVTHSAPALADLEQSLSGYTVKPWINNESKSSIAEENAEETMEEKDDTRQSSVGGRSSRSSDNRSSTSSANGEVEKSRDDSVTSPSEDEPSAEVMMEASLECDIAADQSAASEVDVTDRESESESAEISDKNEENKEENGLEENEEKKTDEECEHERVPENDAEEVVASKAHDEEITENKCLSGDESVQTQTIPVETAHETIYKPDATDTDSQTEARSIEEEPALEVSQPESPDTKETVVSEQQIEEPPQPTSEHKEEVKDSSKEEEQPKRRRHKKRDENTDKSVAETQEELPKPRHRSNKNKDKSEDISEETSLKESKAEDQNKKSPGEKKEPKVKAETEEVSKANTDEPAKTEAEPQEKPKLETEQSPETMHFSYDNIEEISDIKLLEKMLDAADEYEHRRRIRSVIRALKRGDKPTVVKDRKYDTTKSNGALSALQALRARKNEASHNEGDNAKNGSLPQDGAKEPSVTSSRTAGTRTGKTELGSKYSSARTERTTTRVTSGQKKIGSIFDRGDEEEDTRKTGRSVGPSRLGDLERRQVERRRELQRNRSMPASSSKDARKAFVAKLESSTPKTQQAKKVGRSPTFVVPNANNVKQLLLKWCQSKTRGYEHIDVRNFSSSWASGMAFCALVHNFFPDAFDYGKLDPKNRAENFELAFTKADDLGDIPQLLDAEDMISMAEPDWKCVYTYIGEFYKRIREMGLN